MSLVQSKRSASNRTRSNLPPALLGNIAKLAARAASQALKQLTQTSFRGPQAIAPPKRGGRANKGGQTRNGGQTPIPRPFTGGGLRKLTTTLTGMVELGNSLSNTLEWQTKVGYSNGAGDNVLAYLNSRDQFLLKAFVKMKIRSITFTFTSSVPSTDNGYAGIAYYENPLTAPLQNGLTSVQNGAQYIIGSIRQNTVQLRVRMGTYHNEFFYITDVSQDLIHLAAGTVFVYSGNSQAIGARAGVLTFSVDVELT